MQTQKSNIRVLIVEDEKAAREATQRFLEFCGHEVLAASDVESAIALAGHMNPQVVICDCNLNAKYDGVEAARTIQESTGAAIVFVTAYSFAELSRQTQGIIVTGWLRKPISLVELERVVSSALTTES